MKTIVSIEQCVKDLKEMFNIPDERTWKDVQKAEGKRSFYSKDTRTFMIYKGECEGNQVVEKLIDYFESRMLEKGYGLSVNNLTFIYTSFEIVKLDNI